MVSVFCRRILKKSLFSVASGSFGSSDVNIGLSNFGTLKTNSLKEGEGEKNSPKSVEKKVYITLIGIDGTRKSSTLEAAEKLSKRRGLKLLKVNESNSRGPIYKLLSPTQILGEDISHKKQNKGKTGFKNEKIISFSHNISNHDLHSKVQQILKWIQKRHEVRVTISATPSTSQSAESTFEKIDAEVKNHGRILQKRSNGGDIKFQVIPLKENKNQFEKSEENSSKNV